MRTEEPSSDLLGCPTEQAVRKCLASDRSERRRRTGERSERECDRDGANRVQAVPTIHPVATSRDSPVPGCDPTAPRSESAQGSRYRERELNPRSSGYRFTQTSATAIAGCACARCAPSSPATGLMSRIHPVSSVSTWCPAVPPSFALRGHTPCGRRPWRRQATGESLGLPHTKGGRVQRPRRGTFPSAWSRRIVHLRLVVHPPSTHICETDPCGASTCGSRVGRSIVRRRPRPGHFDQVAPPTNLTTLGSRPWLSGPWAAAPIALTSSPVRWWRDLQRPRRSPRPPDRALLGALLVRWRRPVPRRDKARRCPASTQ